VKGKQKEKEGRITIGLLGTLGGEKPHFKRELVATHSKHKTARLGLRKEPLFEYWAQGGKGKNQESPAQKKRAQPKRVATTQRDRNRKF